MFFDTGGNRKNIGIKNNVFGCKADALRQQIVSTSADFGFTLEGVSLFHVVDRAFPDDPDGGTMEVRVEITNDDDGGAFTVLDDPGNPNDEFVGEPGDSVFTADTFWDMCCTDGFAISSLACRSSTFLAFTDVDGNPGNPVFTGLSDWVAYSADGSQIELALEEGRRVRIDVLPAPGCPADLNCDSVVNVQDLLIVLDKWGACSGECLEDIDGSGAVDVGDVLSVLKLWGPCT